MCRSRSFTSSTASARASIIAQYRGTSARGAVLNRPFRAEAGPHAGPDPTGGLPPHPAFGRASPSLLGGELLNLTYPPCLTPPQHRSRARDRDLRGGCPPAPRAGGQLAQPGLTPVPGRFEDSVVVVTRSTRGADRSLDLTRSRWL